MTLRWDDDDASYSDSIDFPWVHQAQTGDFSCKRVVTDSSISRMVRLAMMGSIDHAQRREVRVSVGTPCSACFVESRYNVSGQISCSCGHATVPSNTRTCLK